MRTLPALVFTIGSICMTSVIAAELPEVKEGLWERKSESVAMPGNVKSESKMSLCRSHATEQAAREAAKKVPGCPWVEPTVIGGKFTQEWSCKVGANTITTKSTVTFTADVIHSESHTTFSQPMGGVSEQNDITDQTFKGSCPATMKPGDFMDATGAIHHR